MPVLPIIARVPRGARIATLLLASVTLSACGAATAPASDTSGNRTAALYGGQAFTALVDARARAVTIAPPAGAASTASERGDAIGASLSLLGGDVVRLVPSNVRLSRVGEFAPGRVRVTFDVTIENRLPTLRLVTATWPSPPAPYVVMFPLDYVVTSAPGGAADDGGNDIAIGLPGAGRVSPSVNWDGTGATGSGQPFDFFHEAACTTVGSDCFRWVAFDTPLQAAQRPRTRTVGFDIDASVARFSARMIVVADLAPAIASAP